MKFTLDEFVSFTTPLEGKVDTMYVDAKGYITVGYGNLIGTRKYGEGLPWVRRTDGSRATVTEYDEEFDLLSGKAEKLAKDGWMAAEKLCKLRLTDDGMLDLVGKKLASNEAQLKIGFPDYDNMPADGQLFLHSMAWACGPSFWVAGPLGRYPALRKTINDARLDPVQWVLAMKQCDINPKIGTIVKRNELNKILLWNSFCRTSWEPWTTKDGSTVFALAYPGISMATGVILGDFFTGLVQLLLNRYFQSLPGARSRLDLDGKVGPLTLGRIQDFQRHHGLVRDGIVGPLTLKALLA